MAKEMTKEEMNGAAGVARDDALEGARRATGDASSRARPNPEVAATARRRHFSPEERRRILAAADACSKTGEVGALLRKEGIYSSHLSTWRKERAEAELAALVPKKRGRKADPAIAEARRLDQLTREVVRLRLQLAQAHTIIEVQKKVYTLLEQLTAESPDGKF